MSVAQIDDLENLMQQVNISIQPIDAYERFMAAMFVAISENDSYKVASIQLLLTKILIQTGAYEEALGLNSKALEYFLAIDEELKMAECWRQMALVYQFLGDEKTQLEYLNKSLFVFQRLDDFISEIKVLNNIGHIYFEMGKYEKAEFLFKSNLKKKGLTSDLYVVSLKNLGKVSFEKKEYKKAESIFKEVRILGNNYNLPIYVFASEFFLGQIYAKKKEFYRALPILKNATDLHESKGYFKKELFYMYEVLIEVLVELGDIDSMKSYYDKYKKLNRYLEKQRKSYSLKSMQFKLGISEIEKKRLTLEKENKKLQEANKIIEEQKQALIYKSIELEKVNEELSEFAYRVAHDLKQPILTVKNFIGLLRKNMGGDLSERSTQFMHFIENASIEMAQFVDDILKYAESDQGAFSYELIDCTNLVQQIGSQLDAQLKAANAQLIFGQLEPIYAHRSLILQVFQNLISNAIKFQRAEVDPIVKIKSSRHDDMIVYEISDNGIGIRKENQEKVFKLFSRLNNKSEFTGSGIGLSTAVKILKRYNAFIELDSEYGVGATFKIIFPISTKR